MTGSKAAVQSLQAVCDCLQLARCARERRVLAPAVNHGQHAPMTAVNHERECEVLLLVEAAEAYAFRQLDRIRCGCHILTVPVGVRRADARLGESVLTPSNSRAMGDAALKTGHGVVGVVVRARDRCKTCVRNPNLGRAGRPPRDSRGRRESRAWHNTCIFFRGAVAAHPRSKKKHIRRSQCALENP